MYLFRRAAALPVQKHSAKRTETCTRRANGVVSAPMRKIGGLRVNDTDRIRTSDRVLHRPCPAEEPTGPPKRLAYTGNKRERADVNASRQIDVETVTHSTRSRG